MTDTSSIPEYLTTNNSPVYLDSTHIYYVRLKVYSNTTEGNVQAYWQISEPTMS